jgi:leucyl aminopeptidase
MSLPQLVCHGKLDNLGRHSHLLFIAAAGKKLPPALPATRQWQAVLARRDVKIADLAKAPVAMDLAQGGRAVLVTIDAANPRFDRLTALRKAVMPLLGEAPKELALVPLDVTDDTVRDAVYVVGVNAVALPAQKKKAAKSLAKLHVYGGPTAERLAPALALARANNLTRELTALPPNRLPPADYRRRVRRLAKEHGWRIEEYDFRRLKKMGAGAFCAVAQGSPHQDAAIVHLSWRPRGARRRVAIVGKGICFDTGGHNLKPTRYMAGMHEDMNGSAVAVGLLQAAQELKLPVALDVWLAIAHNHLSPEAYMQGDVVKALDGTTIEVVHTDAEGRMVLADTLTLAAKAKPDLIVDFATLTGSMVTALGSRYSGIFASEERLADLAVAAGVAAGERVCAFPLDGDYEAALDSKVADIKQCTLEGDADHILAARFLKRFVHERPWMHVDLSAVSCAGGLGAVASNVTGFGVGWGTQLLSRWLEILE